MEERKVIMSYIIRNNLITKTLLLGIQNSDKNQCLLKKQMHFGFCFIDMLPAFTLAPAGLKRKFPDNIFDPVRLPTSSEKIKP